jgi:hypothetical protein
MKPAQLALTLTFALLPFCFQNKGNTEDKKWYPCVDISYFYLLLPRDSPVFMSFYNNISRLLLYWGTW